MVPLELVEQIDEVVLQADVLCRGEEALDFAGERSQHCVVRVETFVCVQDAECDTTLLSRVALKTRVKQDFEHGRNQIWARHHACHFFCILDDLAGRVCSMIYDLQRRGWGGTVAPSVATAL